MDIGFIGIGSMGAAMVPNLVKAGHRVTVWNRSPSAAQALEGVTILPTPAAAFETDVAITMLSDDRAVRSVIVDSDALAASRAGCVHIMMSTISPALAEELHQLHRSRGVAYVAAPVFGVPAVAARAELTIVVAGDETAVAVVEPLLRAMGRVWRLGADPRHANVAKIAGNLMIAMAIEAMGEAAALTESYGLNAGDFLEIVTSTLFASPSYQRYGGFIAKDSYEPGLKLTLGLKDVNLAIEAAAARSTVLPSADVVRANMQEAVDRGLGAKDWSILSTVVRRR